VGVVSLSAFQFSLIQVETYTITRNSPRYNGFQVAWAGRVPVPELVLLYEADEYLFAGSSWPVQQATDLGQRKCSVLPIGTGSEGAEQCAKFDSLAAALDCATIGRVSGSEEQIYQRDQGSNCCR